MISQTLLKNTCGQVVLNLWPHTLTFIVCTWLNVFQVTVDHEM